VPIRKICPVRNDLKYCLLGHVQRAILVQLVNNTTIIMIIPLSRTGNTILTITKTMGMTNYHTGPHQSRRVELEAHSSPTIILSAAKVEMHTKFLTLGLHKFHEIFENKVYIMLGIIKRNFEYISKNCFVMSYKSLVRSHLEYENSVWCQKRSIDVDNLVRVQKRATK